MAVIRGRASDLDPSVSLRLILKRFYWAIRYGFREAMERK